MENWIPAISALVGSIVGGLISFLTTYSLKSKEWKNERLKREIEKRENLYSAFISEIGRLVLLSIDRKTNQVSEFSNAYNLLMQIRLIASEEVTTTANGLVQKATRSHLEKEKKGAPDRIEDPNESENHKFIRACRRDLEELKKRG
ncbi:hypothetical protein [Pelagicoccus sp. SDUM812003]|uniref:hypothetical protein n=1 Tax=Pelagicoccus sp. SDUM812003 TaxID=3041267 RepID=UPI00280C8D5E|nr:hypothetical protein [Pelagicoccus sp. SDUM812003]MDQ8205714.1 hypothetical protein [Pelagicoccus sp. SDUM812003]